MTSALVILGAMRELLSKGTLFDGADRLLGSWASSLRIEVFHYDNGFLLAMLPPGAFFGVGLMIALKNVIDKKQQDKKNAVEQQAKAVSTSE